jgi:hypothetical protein
MSSREKATSSGGGQPPHIVAKASAPESARLHGLLQHTHGAFGLKRSKPLCFGADMSIVREGSDDAASGGRGIPHAFLKVGRTKACLQAFWALQNADFQTNSFRRLRNCPAREEVRTVESISSDCNITKHQYLQVHTKY